MDIVAPTATARDRAARRLLAADRAAAGRRRGAAAGGRRTDRWGHLLGTATVVAAFVIGLLCTIQLAGLRREVGRASTCSLHLRRARSTSEAGLLFDPLSAVFVLLITGVGALIHIYSIGYMAHDPGRRRFFAYLNLFVAAMLLLVLGNSYVALYVGWEGVGLASYLLIASGTPARRRPRRPRRRSS